jgi:hypothetical protein
MRGAAASGGDEGVEIGQEHHALLLVRVGAGDDRDGLPPTEEFDPPPLGTDGAEGSSSWQARAISVQAKTKTPRKAMPEV